MQYVIIFFTWQLLKDIADSGLFINLNAEIRLENLSFVSISSEGNAGMVHINVRGRSEILFRRNHKFAPMEFIAG